MVNSGSDAAWYTTQCPEPVYPRYRGMPVLLLPFDDVRRGADRDRPLPARGPGE